MGSFIFLGLDVSIFLLLWVGFLGALLGAHLGWLFSSWDGWYLHTRTYEAVDLLR